MTFVFESRGLIATIIFLLMMCLAPDLSMTSIKGLSIAIPK
nr:MAG TPA: hypothetical protein [Caudoviricetes sp.]